MRPRAATLNPAARLRRPGRVNVLRLQCQRRTWRAGISIDTETFCNGHLKYWTQPDKRGAQARPVRTAISRQHATSPAHHKPIELPVQSQIETSRQIEIVWLL